MCCLWFSSPSVNHKLFNTFRGYLLKTHFTFAPPASTFCLNSDAINPTTVGWAGASRIVPILWYAFGSPISIFFGAIILMNAQGIKTRTFHCGEECNCNFQQWHFISDSVLQRAMPSIELSFRFYCLWVCVLVDDNKIVQCLLPNTNTTNLIRIDSHQQCASDAIKEHTIKGCHYQHSTFNALNDISVQLSFSFSSLTHKLHSKHFDRIKIQFIA